MWQQVVEIPWRAICSSLTALYKQCAKTGTCRRKYQRRHSTESYRRAKIFLFVLTLGGTVWPSVWRSRPSPSSSTARSRSANPSSGVSDLLFTPTASPCSAPGSWMRRFSRWGTLSFGIFVCLRLHMWACSCPMVGCASHFSLLTFTGSVLPLLCWLSKNVGIVCEFVNCPSYSLCYWLNWYFDNDDFIRMGIIVYSNADSESERLLACLDGSRSWLLICPDAFLFDQFSWHFKH